MTSRNEINARFGVTDEQLDAWAAEYDSQTFDVNDLGATTLGRPKLYDEDLETVSFRLPLSRIDAVEQTSKRLGISKSDFFRRAIDRELAVAGNSGA
jgi:hypothetical protein